MIASYTFRRPLFFFCFGFFLFFAQVVKGKEVYKNLYLVDASEVKRSSLKSHYQAEIKKILESRNRAYKSCSEKIKNQEQMIYLGAAIDTFTDYRLCRIKNHTLEVIEKDSSSLNIECDPVLAGVQELKSKAGAVFKNCFRVFEKKRKDEERVYLKLIKGSSV